MDLPSFYWNTSSSRSRAELLLIHVVKSVDLEALPVVVKRVRCAGGSLDLTFDHTWTPLTRMVWGQSLAGTKTLLEGGADPNIPLPHPDRLTALHRAVADDQPTLVEMLLNYGADPACCTVQGVRPLALVHSVDVQVLLESHRLRQALPDEIKTLDLPQRSRL